MTAHRGVAQVEEVVAMLVAAVQGVVLRVPHLVERPKGVRLQVALVADPQQVVVVQPRENPSHHNLEITVKSKIH
jgi:hypothetical protein